MTAGVAVLAVLSGTPSFADVEPARQAAAMEVKGKAGGVLGKEFGPENEGDPVSFEVDAQGDNPLNPTGDFHVVHRNPDGSLVADFSGRITSLYAIDEVAIVTGTIERADHPGVPLELVGKQISLTVYDGGRKDRIGWVWGFFGAPISRVQGTAPHFPVTWGDFRVRGDAGQEAAAAPSSERVDLKSGATGTNVLAVLGGTSKTPQFFGDPLRFTVAARIAPGDNADQVKGKFHVTHHKPDGSVVADFQGRITCLATGGPVGVATGVVTKSVDAGLVGKPVSFSFKDGRTDRLGWLWGFSATDEPINDCQSITPFYAPDWGGLLVR
ncbi:hypothetical protein HPO96_14445 [Kribbella sandramycini]|uniref:Uncharacterized protein n=1 Tax=Kribbella sandramycini TaxID=60450 RepID=A0A7Y4KZC2_9ACTN|nr:hypothetical protein [Kribbella sandramycini]MBB6565174.1 hypothetical protein [Kribbella sandramycini]NOL41444.1 hypothetical protein [Kribbella sandramycini]